MIPGPSHSFSKECPLHYSTAMLPLYWAPQVHVVYIVYPTLLIQMSSLIHHYCITTFLYSKDQEQECVTHVNARSLLLASY